jgi:hypothetical protein
MPFPSEDAHPAGRDQGPLVDGITALLTVIACAAVALRFWARRIAKAGYWWDDWFALAAVVVVLGSNTTRFLRTTPTASILSNFMFKLTEVVVRYGLGKDTSDINPADLTPLFQAMYADMLTYSAGVALIKLAAVLLYARIFPNREFQWMLWAMAVFIICWLVAFEFAFAFQCDPISRFWNHQLPGTCLVYVLLTTSGHAVR